MCLIIANTSEEGVTNEDEKIRFVCSRLNDDYRIRLSLR